MAVIALGEKAVQDLSFYSSIHQKAEELSFKPLVENATPIDNESDLHFSSNAWKVLRIAHMMNMKLFQKQIHKLLL